MEIIVRVNGEEQVFTENSSMSEVFRAIDAAMTKQSGITIGKTKAGDDW